MLSRRNFFSAMIAAGAAATLDPEELLWTPGKKKIFIPPPPPPDHIVRWVLRNTRTTTGITVPISIDRATLSSKVPFVWYSELL